MWIMCLVYDILYKNLSTRAKTLFLLSSKILLLLIIVFRVDPNLIFYFTCFMLDQILSLHIPNKQNCLLQFSYKTKNIFPLLWNYKNLYFDTFLTFKVIYVMLIKNELLLEKYVLFIFWNEKFLPSVHLENISDKKLHESTNLVFIV